MSWQILLTISILSYSFSTLMQRILMKNSKNDPIAYAIFTQILSGIFFAVFAFFNGFHMPNFLPVLPNFFLMIIAFALLNVCIFTAFRTIEASEFTILFLTYGIWSGILAVLFLKETFTLAQVGGTLLICLGVVLVTRKAKHFLFNKGALLTLAAGFLGAVGFINNDFMVKNFDVPSFLVFSYTLPGIAIGFFYPRSVKHIKSFLKPNKLLSLTILSFFYATTGIATFLAYKAGNNAGQIGIIGQTSTIVIVLLSVIFLKETSSLWKKFLGAILGFLGVLLLK